MINYNRVSVIIYKPINNFGGKTNEKLKENERKLNLIFCDEYEIADSFMDTDELKIKDFGEETSPEWARFVRNNRSKKFKDYSDPECNLDNKYDIVIGPIADDDMALLFRQYENGMITFENMLSGMIYKKTTNQYSFHTEKAIALLKKVGV